MVRLQYSKDLLFFPDYTQDNDLWIALQDYQNADWSNLIQLWKCYNLHIIQVINSVDKNRLMSMWDKIMLRKRYIIECINDLLKNKAK